MDWSQFDDEPEIDYDFFDVENDPAEIERRLSDFGALHAYIGQQYAKWSSRCERLFNKRKRAKAEKILYYNDTQDMTVAASKNAARTAEEVVELEKKLEDAQEERDRYKSFLDSLEATKMTLQQLSARQRQEMG